MKVNEMPKLLQNFPMKKLPACFREVFVSVFYCFKQIIFRYFHEFMLESNRAFTFFSSA